MVPLDEINDKMKQANTIRAQNSLTHDQESRQKWLEEEISRRQDVIIVFKKGSLKLEKIMKPQDKRSKEKSKSKQKNEPEPQPEPKEHCSIHRKSLPRHSVSFYGDQK